MTTRRGKRGGRGVHLRVALRLEDLGEDDLAQAIRSNGALSVTYRKRLQGLYTQMRGACVEEQREATAGIRRFLSDHRAQNEVPIGSESG